MQPKHLPVRFASHCERYHPSHLLALPHITPMWTRRLTWTDRPDDWEIYRDGIRMGRVHLTLLQNPQRHAWCWFKQWGHGAQGESETLEQACEDLRAFILKHGEWHMDGKE